MVTSINDVMVSLSPELNALESKLKIKTRTVILLTGFYPGGIGWGNNRSVSTQLILIRELPSIGVYYSSRG